MGLEDKYDLSFLKNEGEKMIFDELDNQLDNEKNDAICKCNDCVLDMAALALNSVKPLYRVSLIGRLYTYAVAEGNNNYFDNVKEAVARAIEKISSNPAH